MMSLRIASARRKLSMSCLPYNVACEIVGWLCILNYSRYLRGNLGRVKKVPVINRGVKTWSKIVILDVILLLLFLVVLQKEEMSWLNLSVLVVVIASLTIRSIFPSVMIKKTRDELMLFEGGLMFNEIKYCLKREDLESVRVKDYSLSGENSTFLLIKFKNEKVRERYLKPDRTVDKLVAFYGINLSDNMIAHVVVNPVGDSKLLEEELNCWRAGPAVEH